MSNERPRENSNIGRVLKHLETKGSITSMEAFSLYGVTRLSAVIFNLRHKYNFNIVGKPITVENRYGNNVTFDKFTLLK